MDQIDQTRIDKITWYYSDEGVYKHSFLILEAAQPCSKFCTFLTEKDKLGVIWAPLDEGDPALAFSHSGAPESRKNYKKLLSSETGLNLRLGDLKARSKDRTLYDVTLKNCHEYAKWLMKQNAST